MIDRLFWNKYFCIDQKIIKYRIKIKEIAQLFHSTESENNKKFIHEKLENLKQQYSKSTQLLEILKSKCNTYSGDSTDSDYEDNEVECCPFRNPKSLIYYNPFL